MFKFLKLRNSDSGDARRHVPFGSIIHKPLSIIFALLFSFVCIVPVKVKALADPVPQFDVINGTNLQTFIGGYTSAGADIQAITNMLIGAEVLEYGGLGDYKIRFEQLPDDATVWDRLVLIGEKVTDDLMSPYVAADRAFTKVIDFCQGALNYAKGFASKVEFFNHVNSLQNFYLNYDRELGYDFNQFFAAQGGLFNWQYSTYDLHPDNFSFVWDSTSRPNQTYYNYFNNMTNRVRANDSASVKFTDLVLSSDFFATYHNIFLNLTSHSCYLCDDSGNQAPNDTIYFDFLGMFNSIATYQAHFVTISSNVINYNNYNSIVTLFNAISLNPDLLITCGNFHPVCLADFVDHLYVGDDWAHRSNWAVNTDLGIGNTDSLEVLNPKTDNDVLFDIKQLVQQIVDAEPAPDYELPLKPIIYNITNVNGSALTAQDLEGLSFNVNTPESGIEVPVNVFLPFFDDGKGFISYMWYMTKPLVQYTRGFLDAITFGPVDGFNASGPGYFILGVAGLGLIGGVIVKFLL